jgi:trigger factor
MNVEIETTLAEGVERRIRVSVPVTEVAAATERAARRYATAARLPGFRAGKAPAAMVRKKFAQEIRQEAMETLLREAYDAVIAKESLQLAAQPHAHDLSFEDGAPFTFELHCEVRPEITFGQLEGFTVTRPVDTVTDAQVQEQLDRLREDRATWTPVTEKAAEGDMAIVMLASQEEDGVMAQPTEYRIEIGKGQAIPGVEELITRCAPGETLEEPVQWPADFPDEAQAGKTKPVRVSVLEVKRRELPPLDDALARELGDFDTVEALTAAVREDMTAAAVRDADAAVRQALLDQLLAANPFPVPPSWVSRLLGMYMESYQIPAEEQARFSQELGPTAERQVRRDLIVESLAEREGLMATEKDVDDRVAELAEKRSIDPGKLYAQLQGAGRLQELERSITEERVFAWLLARNTVVQGA